MLLVSWLTGYLVYLICVKATNNRMGAFLAVSIYFAWGPSHINFPWPSLLALSAGLFTILILSKFLTGTRNPFDKLRPSALRLLRLEEIPCLSRDRFGMTSVGLMTFVTFLFKQNFGVAVLLTVIVSTGLMRPMSQMELLGKIKRYLFGAMVVGLIFTVYLLLTGSLSGFIDNFYFYTIKSFLIGGVAATSFPSGLKGGFYLLPGLVSIIAVFVAYKRQRKALILPIFGLTFYLSGIRPTTDYPHLVVLMSMIGLPLAVIISNFQVQATRNSREHPGGDKGAVVWKTGWLLLGISLIGIGFYTALFKDYYRWDSPLIKQNYFLKEGRAKIFADQKFSMIVPEIVAEIKKNSKRDGFIFVFPNAPMFYFLSGRKNPTRFINFPGGLQTKSQEQEVIEALKNKKVKLILTNEPESKWTYQIIKKHLSGNYFKKKQILEFVIWKRNES